MEFIQSKENAFMKEIRKLKEKKNRTERKQFLVEGFRFVSEALESDFNVSQVFISEKSMDKYESFKIKNKLQNDTKVFCITEQLLKSICSTDTPQGIAAVVNNKEMNIEHKHGFYVLVDKVQDPGNMGTIIRTAHASGALGVLITKGTVDVYNEKTLRSTMGSIFHVPVIEDYDLDKIKKLRENGFKLLVSSLQTDKNFYDIDFSEKIIISVGNEGNGISKEVEDLADIKAKIPMPGNAESLNAAVAASIMMFEAVRQKLIK